GRAGAQVWAFAADEPLGAFDDDASLPGFHDRVAAAYPAYDAFITDYRVVDRYGRALYGTAETRMFPLKQLISQAPRPKSIIANVGRASARPSPSRAHHPHIRRAAVHAARAGVSPARA